MLELSKIWAGPYTGKLLALLGAEVIRVESYDSLDATRRYGVKDINDAPGFQAVNPGKCSVQLNVRTAEGLALIKELVKKSDIFVENLRPGAAGRLGLGYEVLRSLRPEIVAVSMSMYVHQGPLSYQTGYAACFSALAGVCHLVGYEDGPPRLLNIRYGDSSYGTAAAFAAIVALCHRQQTGQGQFVDVSAVEALAAMLGDSFMEYSLTGRIPTRDGNRHAQMAPHGCYPCAGDEWISIAVRTDEEWQALCEAMHQPDLAARYPDGPSRQANSQQLDAIVANWTRPQEAHELEAQLGDRGVAAFKSLSSIDLVSNEHLWNRGFYTHVTDNKQRSVPIVGAPWKLCPRRLRWIQRKPPRRLGEHNDYGPSVSCSGYPRWKGSGWSSRKSSIEVPAVMPITAEELVKQAEAFIEYKKDPKTRIAYLTLNRPDRLNAPTVGMRLLFGDIIHRANIDDEVKVLVVRGAGETLRRRRRRTLGEQNQAYTEGTNASLLHEFEIDDPDVKYPDKDSFRYIHGLCEHYAKARGGCRSLQEFKKISIVEAKGYCYGWHFYQTADADMVISSDEALFGHPAFRYVGWGPRLWTWIETMGLRRFQEMLFTGRPFTAQEMYDCGFVNSVVPREKLEEETHKYATACARTRPVDTVAVQKTFLEIYKQYRGEYMGSQLTSMIEALWPYMKHDPGELKFGAAMFEAGVNNTVKDLENAYPPEWRMSRSGRKRT